MKLLRAIEKKKSMRGAPPIRWMLISAKMESPLRMTFKPEHQEEETLPQIVRRDYISGFRQFKAGMIDPGSLTDDEAESYKEVADHFQNGIRSMTIGAPGVGRVRITNKSAERVLDLFEEAGRMIQAHKAKTIPLHDEWTTMMGRLEALNFHSEKKQFVLYDGHNKKGTKCTFPPELHGDIEAAISIDRPKTVAVSGLATIDEQGDVTGLEVEHFQILPYEEELPEVIELSRLNISGDEDPADFVRRGRDAEREEEL